MSKPILPDHPPAPDATRALDQPFLMAVEDVLALGGRGTVAIGSIERGRVTVGDALEVVGLGETRPVTCGGVQSVRKLRDDGQPAAEVAVLLQGIAREHLARGMVLCAPGSVGSHTRFAAEIAVLTPAQGGRYTPLFNRSRPQLSFRTIDVTGVVTLPRGMEMAMPGDHVRIEVELTHAIACEKSQRFAIREGGQAVGTGVVTRIQA